MSNEGSSSQPEQAPPAAAPPPPVPPPLLPPQPSLVPPPPPPAPPRRRLSRWAWVAMALALGLGVSVVINAALLTVVAVDSVSDGPAGEFVETTLESAPTFEKIAVIDLFGVISYGIEGEVGTSMVEDLQYQFQRAAEDPQVRAVILRIDSPGGEVNASDVLFHEVKKLARAHRTPVVVLMMSVAASGGYYVAAGADWIVANPRTITGSIGVIMQSVDYRELLDKVGLDFRTFKSGKFKDLLSGSREATTEEIDFIQNFVMESYERFVGIVAEERELPLDTLRHRIADGRIFSGEQALEVGLVDEVGYFEDAVERALKLAKLSQARLIMYEPSPSFSDIFSPWGRAADPPSIEINWIPKALQFEPGKAYYLSTHIFSP